MHSVEITGVDSQSKESFKAIIRPPEREANGGDYYCVVESDEFFSCPNAIWGVTKEQALALSLDLLKTAMQMWISRRFKIKDTSSKDNRPRTRKSQRSHRKARR